MVMANGEYKEYVEKVKQGLRVCSRYNGIASSCSKCPYVSDDDCTGAMTCDAYEYIEQLEALVKQRDQVINELKTEGRKKTNANC